MQREQEPGAWQVGIGGLVANVVAALAFVSAVNYPARFLGLTFGEPREDLWLVPPGWVIGVVWFCLFALMGAARWALVRAGYGWKSRPTACLLALAVWCATYVYYTVGLAKVTGFREEVLGLVGTFVAISLAGGACTSLWQANRLAGMLVLPVLLWCFYALTITLRLVF